MQQQQMVNRGVSLFNQLVIEEYTIPQDNQITKGRDTSLIDARNEFLFHRFVFKAKHERKLYNDVLKELRNEIFLSVRTIQDILQQHGDEVLLIKKQNLSALELKKKYPQWIW